jgi:hypothetical protein
MKKKLFSILILLVSQGIFAQGVQDAVRFSQDNLNGTARFRAMSGAFGALGGDLSSINVNPAGSAVFLNNQIALTVNNTGIKNNSSYFGTNASDRENNFDLNQAGAVFVYKNTNSASPWKKFSFTINYENLNNYRNTVYFEGQNPNSLANYFTANANGVPLELLETIPGESVNDLYAYLAGLPDFQFPNIGGFQAQQALLGYQSFLINPVNNSPENTNYVANAAGGQYFQQNYIVNSGNSGKVTFNFAAQYEDWLYLGANLNSHFTEYRSSTRFYETAGSNAESGVNRIRFDNNLRTFGNGFSMNFGAIGKFEDFRVGIAYESPTWQRFTDQLTQSISTNCLDCDNGATNFVINPLIVNEYPSYRVNTPGRWTGSLAYIFGGNGLLSADFAVRDYRNVRFRPNDSYFSPINSQLSDLLVMAAEIRVGAEYKIQRLSLRGGYRYEQSPYENGRTVGDLTGYSGGFGYNFGSTKVDLAYSFFQRDYDLQSFNVGLTDAARIQNSQSTVTLSVLFDL